MIQGRREGLLNVCWSSPIPLPTTLPLIIKCSYSVAILGKPFFRDLPTRFFAVTMLTNVMMGWTNTENMIEMSKKMRSSLVVFPFEAMVEPPEPARSTVDFTIVDTFFIKGFEKLFPILCPCLHLTWLLFENWFWGRVKFIYSLRLTPLYMVVKPRFSFFFSSIVFRHADQL